MDKQIASRFEALRHLAAAGNRGSQIEPHRSLHQLPFPVQRISVMVLLPALFNLATWAVRDSISGTWLALFKYWVPRLELPVTVSARSMGQGIFAIVLPHVDVPTRAPDPLTWWLTLAVTLLCLLATVRLPSDFLPLCYFLRFLCIIQASALAFFAATPAAFHYTVPDYLDSSLLSGAMLMLLLPWLHGLTYHIFDFSLGRKALFTFLSLAFICVALPMQLLVHLLLLNAWSVLMLPLLYLMLGLWLQILAAIALYGWAMSWKHG